MRYLFIVLALYCFCVIAIVGTTMHRTVPVNPFAEYALWMPGNTRPLEVGGWNCEHFWDVYISTHGHFYCINWIDDTAIVRWISVSGNNSRISRTTFAVRLQYGDLVEWYGRYLTRARSRRTGTLLYDGITAYGDRWDWESGLYIPIRYVSFTGVD